MKEVVAGAASGFLMGLVFVTGGVFILFSLAKDPPPLLKEILLHTSLTYLSLSISTLALALWGVIGLILGVVFRGALQLAPGEGLGSPNLTYTLIVIALGLAPLPAIVLLRIRPYRAVLAIMVGFTGIFGWFLPYFAR